MNCSFITAFKKYPIAYFPLDEKFGRREIFNPIGMRNKTIMQ